MGNGRMGEEEWTSFFWAEVDLSSWKMRAVAIGRRARKRVGNFHYSVALCWNLCTGRENGGEKWVRGSHNCTSST
jgi:hypothetical protein